MLDITKPEVGVQIQVRDDGKVLWVNVDGECALRVCQIPQVEVEWQGRFSATKDAIVPAADNGNTIPLAVLSSKSRGATRQ